MSSAGTGVPAAFAAGLLSFASPCVLPLVPAYLAVVTGLDVTRTRESAAVTSGTGAVAAPARVARGAVAWDASLFVAGFTAVFVVLGLSATALGSTVSKHHTLLTRISGVLLVVMAIFLIATLFARAGWIYSERRFRPSLSRFGPFAAPVAGAAFALGWTPCIGPVLASVLAVAATQGHAAQGALLLLAYSAGLGLPFIVAGVAFDRVRGVLQWVRRHGQAVTIVSATAMAGFGVLLVLDRLSWVTTEFQRVL